MPELVFGHPPTGVAADAGIRKFSRTLVSAVREVEDASVDVVETEATALVAGLPESASVVLQYGAGGQFSTSEYHRALQTSSMARSLHVVLHDLGGMAYPNARDVAVETVRGLAKRALGRASRGPRALDRWRVWRTIQKEADSLMVCYVHERERLPNHLQAKCVVIDHPTPVPEPIPDRADARRALGVDERLVVTLLGFISPRKGFYEALEALDLLGAQAQMVFAGAPVRGFEDDVARAIEPYGDRVIQTGWLETAEQRRWMAATDVAIAPFRSVAASGSILEWLAHGRTVVTTQTPLAEELNRRTDGLVVTYAGGPEELAATIREADTHRCSAGEPLVVTGRDVGRRIVRAIR